MTTYRRTFFAAPLALAIAVASFGHALADQPTRFTFTPTFQDPDPGKRVWEQWGNGYREILPSGRVNIFTTVRRDARGTTVKKTTEPNFFVFIPDSNAKPRLYWARTPGPWNFMGVMKDVSAPQRID